MADKPIVYRPLSFREVFHVPTFDVTIQDKTYHVEIPDPGATPLQIIVDGEAFIVGVVGTELVADPAPLASIPRPTLQPSPLPPLPRVALPRPIVPTAAHVGGEIVAPMPGTILSVAIEVGQQIEAGHVVCVLEAMKMKNPIRATHTGRVTEIAVQAGQTVAYGDLLARLM
jgi:glutaconyl-CoA/methylmalonyl-CoA decarboxylase subunit gamma